MLTTLANISTNKHIRALEQILASKGSTVHWLVIAHDDPPMIRSLTAALPRDSAALLRVSQDAWDLDGGSLPEAIEWALHETAIENLVLVGHSCADGSNRLSPSEIGRDASPGSYGRLAGGVRRHNEQVWETQQRFAAQMRQLAEIPVVHSRRSHGELTVYGLYYRSENDVFLTYDVEHGTCRPLVG